jgi:hypothetical protein
MTNGLSTHYRRTGALAPIAQAAFLAQQQRQECRQIVEKPDVLQFCGRHGYVVSCPKAR